jgi:hypothetical protein
MDEALGASGAVSNMGRARRVNGTGHFLGLWEMRNGSLSNTLMRVLMPTQRAFFSALLPALCASLPGKGRPQCMYFAVCRCTFKAGANTE